MGWKLVCILDIEPFPRPDPVVDTASYCHSGAAAADEYEGGCAPDGV